MSHIPNSAIGNRQGTPPKRLRPSREGGSAISGGFTLTELMVAVAITAILILAINQVFTTVSDAVSRGAALSDVLTAHRLISDQLRSDFDHMVRPVEGSDPGGVLIIVNRYVRGVDNDGNRVLDALDGGVGSPTHHLDAPDADPHGVFVLRTDDYNNNGELEDGEPRRPVRDDQFMFIRNRDDLQPLCPSSNTSYSASPQAQNAQYVKVWYGHALRIDPRGSTHIESSTTTVRYRVRELGQPDLYGPLPPDRVQGLNQFASEWILGRQALFLQTSVPIAPADTNFVQIADTDATLGTTFTARLWHANLLSNEDVPATDGGANPVSLDRPTNVNSVIRVPPSLYAGLSDVAKYGLNREDDPDTINVPPVGPVFGAMVGGIEPAAGPPPYNPDLRLWQDLPASPGGGKIGYAARAYNYMYIPAPLDDPTIDNHARNGRLWVNPAPNPDLDDSLTIDNPAAAAGHPIEEYYPPWQIAQMHAYLAGRVSDFSVEFAGDYIDDTAIVNVPLPATPPGPVAAPAGPDDTIDHYDFDTTGVNRVEDIIWYGIDVYPPLDPAIAGAFVDVTHPVALQNPIFDDKTMLPIDPPFNFGTQGFYIGTTIQSALIQHNTDIRYVFRHGSGATNWPKLLRIRYRIHDPQNKIVDPDGEPGRWFEVILHVPQ